MNPMEHRRQRASRKLSNPGPWDEVMIQKEAQQQVPGMKTHIGSPRIDEDHRRPQRMRRPRTPAAGPDPGRAMWSSSSSRASDTFYCVQQGGSSPSENSEQQWCQRPQDPSNKGGQEGSESSVVTDDEAIAVQSLLALELLASSVRDSAASRKKKTRRSTKKKSVTSTQAAATRRVFVPCLGLTILQRQVEPRRAAPRSGELSRPGLKESGDDQSGDLEPPRSRSKRKRVGKIPPKFQDSLMSPIKQQQQQQEKPRRKKSRKESLLALEMVLLSWVWSKPRSSEALKEPERGFNYETEEFSTAAGAGEEEHLEQVRRRGFAINHSRVKVGQGEQAYSKAKRLLQDWRHFELGWAFVEPQVPIDAGQAFCVCSRELLVWIVNPLRVRFVQEDEKKSSKRVYAFGSGTLQGHLLAGEERFAVEWNQEDDSVWYEIFSFSKPAHPLALATYPYVRLKQKRFAQQSSRRMAQEMLRA